MTTTPLHDVAANGAYREISRLIAGGARINDADPDGRTPLDIAISAGCGDTIAILRSHGARRSRELSRANAPKAQMDLVTYINGGDVSVVRERLPSSVLGRLREVHLAYASRDLRTLGWVTKRGRRDINLCAVLPPRVSLGRYVTRHPQSSRAFGAEPQGQWTPWAVRRFLLYDVLLHELGHLQVVHPGAADPDRKFASETRAQEFADHWRHELWSVPFEHADPVHSLPSDDELSFLPRWRELNKQQRLDLVWLAVSAPLETAVDLEARFGPLTESQLRFLDRALNEGRRDGFYGREDKSAELP